MKVVAQFFQEAEDIRDTADCGQSQGVLLLVKVGWTGQRTQSVRCTAFNFYVVEMRKSNMPTEKRVSLKQSISYLQLFLHWLFYENSGNV